jgi:hypothetical protein
MSAVAVGRSRLPTRYVGTIFVSGSSATKVYRIAGSPRTVERPHVAQLLADISPNLVNLDTAAGQLAHLPVHELCAAIVDFDEKPADRVAMRPGHALGRPDKVILGRAIDDLDSAGERTGVHGRPVVMTASLWTHTDHKSTTKLLCAHNRATMVFGDRSLGRHLL